MKYTHFQCISKKKGSGLIHFLLQLILLTEFLQNYCNTSVPFKFFEKNPDYKFLKVFDGLCFPHLAHCRKDKLILKSVSCVFLGYIPFHKGYKCYDLVSKRVVTSVNVAFNEVVFLLISSSGSATFITQDISTYLSTSPVIFTTSTELTYSLASIEHNKSLTSPLESTPTVINTSQPSFSVTPHI